MFVVYFAIGRLSDGSESSPAPGCFQVLLEVTLVPNQRLGTDGAGSCSTLLSQYGGRP